MMWKLNGRMDKGGHYYMEMKLLLYGNERVDAITGHY